MSYCGTYSSICCRGFGTLPDGDTAFVAHDCFTLRNADAFYSLDWVQPVVHPYSLRGPLKGCPWYNFWSVFPTRQWSEIEDYIKIYAISGDNYHPLTQTNACRRSIDNSQSVQSVADKHVTAGPWDPWLTLTRRLTSQAMLLVSIVRLTGLLWPS